MTKTIIASLTGLSSDRTVMESAVAAARIDGGHIQCLHTRIDAVKTSAEAGFILPHHASNLHGLLQKIATQEEGRSRHARQVFDEVRKRHAIGMSPCRAAADINLGRFEQWTNPERNAWNAVRVYAELDGKLTPDTDTAAQNSAVAEYTALRAKR